MRLSSNTHLPTRRHRANTLPPPSSGKLMGKCLVPLQPLLTGCELAVSSPILTEGRREAGGSVELALRLRKPIASDEVVVTEVKPVPQWKGGALGGWYMAREGAGVTGLFLVEPSFSGLMMA